VRPGPFGVRRQQRVGRVPGTTLSPSQDKTHQPTDPREHLFPGGHILRVKGLTAGPDGARLPAAQSWEALMPTPQPSREAGYNPGLRQSHDLHHMSVMALVAGAWLPAWTKLKEIRSFR
jgi:hypothetical protein